MSKVAIIGNGGGGKSTLAIKLGKALRIDVHHIDRIQFKPGWKLTPPEEVARTHGAILAADRWIIDGWGGWQLMERRFASADTIILIDLPLSHSLLVGIQAADYLCVPFHCRQAGQLSVAPKDVGDDEGPVDGPSSDQTTVVRPDRKVSGGTGCDHAYITAKSQAIQPQLLRRGISAGRGKSLHLAGC